MPLQTKVRPVRTPAYRWTDWGSPATWANSKYTGKHVNAVMPVLSRSPSY
jgi:hypothetical protein